MFQREMQKANSQASMRGQRPRTAALMSRLADMDIARKLAFGEIGLSRRRSDIAHRGRKAALGIQKDQLKQRKKQLPWTIGLGLGTAGLSAYEGNRRANMIAAQNQRQEDRYQQTRRGARTNEYALRQRLGTLPVGMTSSGRR